jgi:hypothetical protein
MAANHDKGAVRAAYHSGQFQSLDASQHLMNERQVLRGGRGAGNGRFVGDSDHEQEQATHIRSKCLEIAAWPQP